ncbi:uncharacterized protein LACBIDRAFT_327520 [Laccaria bicolor S238N-H82]|uniref:Predicted protein n=1 Tax=Laccaria bicolor (strain S238N-H82 / ATCC MYA-4686) TaxID=486041 RepID=B0DC00_LACBS|nr:uncharacterized protein LACBIDRAFT_327520 [Laccaria bicolor S238N-H82]EDR07646.1 predicted protein [Laccaria bicolor S238N-H82]|eukprot:XP_001881435.1 predicted protein [Laccaria bicolor S238N-H82]
MEYEGIIDHFNPILPNAGILPFNGLETARELDEVYERVLPFDLTQTRHGPMFQNGNWFAGAIKRRRRAEIKASRTISLDSISRALILPTELLLEIELDLRIPLSYRPLFRYTLNEETQEYTVGSGGVVCVLMFSRRVLRTSLNRDGLLYCLARRRVMMVARFIFFNSRISSGIPDASLEFEDFKSLEIANVIRGHEESNRANALILRMGVQVMEEHNDNMKQLLKRYLIRRLSSEMSRTDLCISHASILLRRGHDQVDLDIATGELLDRYSYRERFTSNYRSNKQLALELLRTSETHKIDRLEKQRWFLIFYRQKVTLPPTSWPNLPNVEAIYEHEPFAAFIASESKEVGKLPEETVQTHLAPFLDSWMQVHESNILARLESPYENLDLAANVFICASCESEDDCTRRRTSILIGLENLRAHFKCIDPQCEFRFSISGRAVALALLDLLGMDPKTVTVSILDARDARFFCEGCDVSWKRGVLGRQPLTWRECISHVIEMENTNSHHSITSWALLTAEATECIKRHEQPFPSPECDIWCCYHCPEHYDDATTKANAFRHAKDERKFPHLKPRKPISVGLEPPEIYQCGKCPDTINRLWQIDRLKPHLLDNCVAWGTSCVHAWGTGLGLQKLACQHHSQGNPHYLSSADLCNSAFICVHGKSTCVPMCSQKVWQRRNKRQGLQATPSFIVQNVRKRFLLEQAVKQICSSISTCMDTMGVKCCRT